jgi:LemA protein
MDSKILILVLAGIVIIPGVFLVTSYNGLVSSQIQVDEAWAQVQVQYQRRYDLIPRIVNSTKLYIEYEQQLLTDIAEARSAWTSSLEGGVEGQMAASQEIDSVFNRLLAIVVVEDYPELQADQVVLTLIDELEGTENRIAVARMNYNEAVTRYVKRTRLFPGNIVAGIFGFQEKPFYEANPDAAGAPNVPA